MKRCLTFLLVLAVILGARLEAAPAETPKGARFGPAPTRTPKGARSDTALAGTPKGVRPDAAAVGTPKAPGDDDRLIINLSDATLHIVVQYISLIKGKMVKLPNDFKGDESVNIISSAEAGIPRDKAMDIFAMILRGAGYVMEETPDYIRIVPEAEAKAVPIRDGSEDSGDGLACITKDVTYRTAGDLVASLKKLCSSAGSVEANVELNKLIIKDYGPNRRAILCLLKLLDQKDVDFITKTCKLKNRSVDSLSSLVTKFVTNMKNSAGVREKAHLDLLEVVAQPTNNSFILFGDPVDIDRVIVFIRQFDAKPDEGNTGFHTYHVKNRDVNELKDILDKLLAESATSKTPGSAGLQEDAPKIIPDETNAQLIVFASIQKYREIEPWLRDLDIEQPSVEIESTYIEVTTEKLADFGVELASLDGPSSNARGFLATSMGLSTVTDEGRLPIEPTLGGLTTGVFKDEVLSIAALARLSQKDEDITFVAAPSVTTTDNKEATILLSEEREYLTSTISIEGSTREETSGGFHKAETELIIKPHVKEDGVRLDIMTRVEQFLPSSNDLTNISRSKVETVVNVPDGSTVVIGGLTRTVQSKEVRKVPILGDIPLLSFFFKRTITTDQKRHLCVFIRPRVHRTGKALVAETQKRLETLNAEYPESLPGLPKTLENSSQGAKKDMEVSNPL